MEQGEGRRPRAVTSQIIGLFANSADAESYAKDHSLKDWRVAEVISPMAFAESQAARRPISD
jgi:hypothetical protein